MEWAKGERVPVNGWTAILIVPASKDSRMTLAFFMSISSSRTSL